VSHRRGGLEAWVVSHRRGGLEASVVSHRLGGEPLQDRAHRVCGQALPGRPCVRTSGVRPECELVRPKVSVGIEH
jgi:hypothetical protein